MCSSIELYNFQSWSMREVGQQAVLERKVSGQEQECGNKEGERLVDGKP